MSVKRENRVLDMTRENLLKCLLQFAIPVFLANLLQQLYNVADTSLAGNILGDTALAQIGATSSLYNLVIEFAFGLNSGFTLIVSRYFGANDSKGVRGSSGWMILLSIVLSLILAAGLLIFRRPILDFLKVPDAVYEGALEYITIIFVGIPLTMLYNMESALLRSVGNSVTPLYFLLFSSALNILLDVLFMGPFGFGVQGAAAATILSQAVSAFIGLFYMFANYPQFRFTLSDLKENANGVPEMMRTGMSMAMMNTIYSIGSVIMQSAVNALGSIYIAGQVGGRKLSELFMAPGGAIAASVATFTSQNFGAYQRERIKKGCIAGIILYLCWWVIAMVFLFTLAPLAIKMITGSSDDQILSSAILYLRFSISSLPPLAVLVVIRNTLQGVKHTLSPLIASSIELGLKVIFAFYLVPTYGYIAACACEPTTWVVCALYVALSMVYFREEFKDDYEQKIRSKCKSVSENV